MDPLKTFLQKIKETRIKKNISLEDISQSTKINSKFIEHLDEGDTDFLPQLYVRAFVKSYARFVGIPQKEIEEQLIIIASPAVVNPEKEETVEKPVEKKPEPIEPRKKKRIAPQGKDFSFLKGSTIRLALFIIPVIAGLIYVGTQLNQSRNRFEVANIPVSEEEKANIDLTARPQPEKIQMQPISLRAVSSATTWLRVIIDQRDTSEHNLRQGDQVNWSAASQIRMRIGRAHALRLFLNGQDLGPLGPETQLVWEMIITGNGIESKELRTRTDLPQQSSPNTGPEGAN